jgi:hypothetical protein
MSRRNTGSGRREEGKTAEIVLKMVSHAGLIHNRVCHVPGRNFSINSYRIIGNGAVPNIVISLSVPQK